MDWDQLATTMMDQAIDDRLGDTLSYAANGVDFFELKGFVLLSHEGLGVEAIDEVVATRPRVKIAKARLPYPEPNHRLRHRKLGLGVFQPGSVRDDTDSRYWLFDVEPAQ
ncbi:MAG: hypothetical protein K2X76_05180 [Sphingomonas sp.]|nr:hypothetical protein [Sphingomonas sp.]